MINSMIYRAVNEVITLVITCAIQKPTKELMATRTKLHLNFVILFTCSAHSGGSSITTQVFLRPHNLIVTFVNTKRYDHEF